MPEGGTRPEGVERGVELDAEGRVAGKSADGAVRGGDVLDEPGGDEGGHGGNEILREAVHPDPLLQGFDLPHKGLMLGAVGDVVGEADLQHKFLFVPEVSQRVRLEEPEKPERFFGASVGFVGGEEAVELVEEKPVLDVYFKITDTKIVIPLDNHVASGAFEQCSL